MPYGLLHCDVSPQNTHLHDDAFYYLHPLLNIVLHGLLWYDVLSDLFHGCDDLCNLYPLSHHGYLYVLSSVFYRLPF